MAVFFSIRSGYLNLIGDNKKELKHRLISIPDRDRRRNEPRRMINDFVVLSSMLEITTVVMVHLQFIYGVNTLYQTTRT